MPTPPTPHAVCYGSLCTWRGRCALYHGVETPGEERFIATCRTPEHEHPLFEARVVQRRSTAPIETESDGGETD